MNTDNITTKEQFELFKLKFYYWADEFGLKEWAIDFEHNDKETESLAWIRFNVFGRTATVGLTLDWGEDDMSDKMVEQCAFHELMELMLAKMAVIPFIRTTDEEGVNEEVHIIIRRWENFMRKIGKL